MNTDYNLETAKHYSSYRPPLHKIILKKVLLVDQSFSTGLDIGCGTGYSTIALAKYCSNVVGIEPSQAMLDRATDHPKIKYIKASGEKIPLPDNSVDIVTLAGSLFYMNVDLVGSEIKRVCKHNAFVIVYDFKILLKDVLESLSVYQRKNKLDYDYQLNFAGHKEFEKIQEKQEQVKLEFLGEQLAHVLLSEPHVYKKFCNKFSIKDPFQKLRNILMKSGNHFFITAEIYYSAYRISD